MTEREEWMLLLGSPAASPQKGRSKAFIAPTSKLELDDSEVDDEMEITTPDSDSDDSSDNELENDTESDASSVYSTEMDFDTSPDSGVYPNVDGMNRSLGVDGSLGAQGEGSPNGLKQLADAAIAVLALDTLAQSGIVSERNSTQPTRYDSGWNAQRMMENGFRAVRGLEQ